MWCLWKVEYSYIWGKGVAGATYQVFFSQDFRQVDFKFHWFLHALLHRLLGGLYFWFNFFVWFFCFVFFGAVSLFVYPFVPRQCLFLCFSNVIKLLIKIKKRHIGYVWKNELNQISCRYIKYVILEQLQQTIFGVGWGMNQNSIWWIGLRFVPLFSMAD